MANHHALSYIHPKAELDDSVSVGPFCYVEAGVRIGKGTVLDSHATIKSGTTVGENCFVGQGAVLGGDPQDRKYDAEPTYLEIGDHNTFREYVTVHRATGAEKKTVIGNRNFLMAYTHVGHNCTLRDDITIANSVGISGHATIEEFVTIGGMVGVHQYCRVGKVAMVGGMSRIVQDVPPFMVTEGEDQEVHDINAIGLRRVGITSASRMSLHKACKLLFKSQLGLANAIELVRREVPITDEVEYLLAFVARRYQGKHGRGDQP